jgi:hypothetical protein
LLDHDDHTDFISPITTANGERICATRMDRLTADGGGFAVTSVLECRSRSQPRPERIWVEDSGRLHDFDDRGQQLLLEATFRGKDGYLLNADFSKRTVRRVIEARGRWWSFLPGGERIVGERARGVVCDLARGYQWSFGRPGSEWEFFAPVPNDPDRFIISQAAGATNDLYWVTLPKSGQSP